MAHLKNAKIADSTELVILHYHCLITFHMLACHKKRIEQKKPVFLTAWGEMFVVREKM